MFSTTFEIGGVIGSAVIGIVLDRYVLNSRARLFKTNDIVS